MSRKSFDKGGEIGAKKTRTWVDTRPTKRRELQARESMAARTERETAKGQTQLEEGKGKAQTKTKRKQKIISRLYAFPTHFGIFSAKIAMASTALYAFCTVPCAAKGEISVTSRLTVSDFAVFSSQKI